MKTRNRIKTRGFYEDSTDNYGSIVDRFDPIGVLRNPLEVLDKIPLVRMTRKEFESENMFAKALGNINKCYPDASLSKRSKIYRAVRNEIYRLVYLNRKALN